MDANDFLRVREVIVKHLDFTDDWINRHYIDLMNNTLTFVSYQNIADIGNVLEINDSLWLVQDIWGSTDSESFVEDFYTDEGFNTEEDFKEYLKEFDDFKVCLYSCIKIKDFELY